MKKPIPLARRVRELARGRQVVAREDRNTVRWLTLAVVFVLIVLITSPSVWVEPLPIHADERIDSPIISQTTFDYISPEMREDWTRRREREHVRVFTYHSRVRGESVDRVANIIEQARDDADQAWPDDEALRAHFAGIDDDLAGWPVEKLRMLMTLARDERFRTNAPRIVDDVYSNDLLISGTDWAKWQTAGDDAFRRVEQSHLARDPGGRLRRVPEETGVLLRNLVVSRLAAMLPADQAPIGERPDEPRSAFDRLDSLAGRTTLRLLQLGVMTNLVFDEDLTQQEFDRFEPVQPQRIHAGEWLVPRLTDETAQRGVTFPYALTQADADLLAAYQKPLTRSSLLRFAAQVLFVFFTFLIISFYVTKFSRELGFTSQTVLMLSLPLLLALGLGRIFLLIAGEGSLYAGYAFPAGVIGILGVLLLDMRLALMLVTIGCLLFGLEANLEYEFVIVGLFGGYTAVGALSRLRERREVLYAGLLIGFVNASTILILSTISGRGEEALTAAVIGALSGVMCSLIAFAVLPVLEVIFHITTDLRLLELCGYQHPLLKRMEEEAPGTLQHTMNVAKLAESAATAIGVNYLLVRAGVYFHDIGKMSKPEYFTENQITPEDKRRHQELKPQMSTLIIRNHVKEGIEMAREHNLPRVIIDFIPEHHGTSLIQFFHHKAQSAYDRGETKEPVREEDYRYPGPRPQSIETAIAMLADTVEATATARLSGRIVRDDEIQMLVRNAIVDRFNDGQFDDCNLTLRDLNVIRESFVKTLRSRFHSRIDYPEARKQAEPPRRPPRERERDDNRRSDDSVPVAPFPPPQPLAPRMS